VTNHRGGISCPSLFSRLQPDLIQAFELLNGAPHEQSAIVEPDRDTTIIPALDNLAGLIAQRHFGFPGECSGNKLDSIAYLEIAISSRITFIHLSFAFSPPCALASIVFSFLARLRIADSLRFISAAIAAACFPAAANL
jgi:hypothetical protein